MWLGGTQRTLEMDWRKGETPTPPGRDRRKLRSKVRYMNRSREEEGRKKKKKDYFNPFLRKFWDPLTDILGSGIKRKSSWEQN